MTEVFARVSGLLIDEQAVRDAVVSPACGAEVVFRGVIRDHDGGESVRSLDYSAHPLAEEFLLRIVNEEIERTSTRLAAWHRIGALEIGDAALVVVAAAPHRREAFAAVETLVERIKAEVPIWKRQYYAARSSAWVGL